MSANDKKNSKGSDPLIVYVGEDRGFWQTFKKDLSGTYKQFKFNDEVLFDVNPVKLQNLVVELIARRPKAIFFDLSKFSHHAVYNESQNRVEMYLKSLCAQTVQIPDTNMSINLLENELIHTENSYKFSIPQIESKFKQANIRINKIWYDSRNYFALILGQKI